jgi:hypothetical protein
VVDSQPFMHILDSERSRQQKLSHVNVHFADDGGECTPTTPLEFNARPARTMPVRSLLEEVARSLEQGLSSAAADSAATSFRAASRPLSVKSSEFRDGALGSAGSLPLVRSAGNASKESLTSYQSSSLARIPGTDVNELVTDQPARDAVALASRGRSDFTATPANQQITGSAPIKANIDTVTATSIAELLKSSLAHIPDTIPEDACVEQNIAVSSGDLVRHLTTQLQAAHTELHAGAHKSVIGLFGRTGGPLDSADQPPSGDADLGHVGAPSSTMQETTPVQLQASAGVDWNVFDAEMAHQLQRQFESGLKEAYRFADGAMMVVAPELAENEVILCTSESSTRCACYGYSMQTMQTERYKRLARFSIVMMKCQRRVEQCISKRCTLRYLHDTILGFKLELFR